jgi:hypothetical protein
MTRFPTRQLQLRQAQIDTDTASTQLHIVFDHNPGPFGDSNSGPRRHFMSGPVCASNPTAINSENALILVNMNRTIYDPSRVGETGSPQRKPSVVRFLGHTRAIPYIPVFRLHAPS